MSVNEKRIKTWKSNPENEIRFVKNVKDYIRKLSKEERKERAKKAVKTKKEKGYNFYNFSFGKMTDEEKKKMYKKISKNNKRSQPILMIDENDNIIKEFHSIGAAGRYLHETYNYNINCKVYIRRVLDTDKLAYGFKWRRK